jgi:transcriptional regulator with XRE-family HTH domain
METFVDRIQYLINKNNLKASYVLNQLDLSGSTITDWKKGKGRPSAEAIIKFATFFNVSTDYLLLGIHEENSLDISEKEWLNLYHQLSDHDKIECTGFIKGYIAASQNVN